MIEQFQVEQAIRKSHCSNSGREHACVGTCMITPKGIELSCTLCGSDKPSGLDVNEWLADRAADIFHAAGMLFHKLSPETQATVLKELGKDYCPNCKTVAFHTRKFQDHLKCRCGWEWSSYCGWKAPVASLYSPLDRPIDPDVEV